MPLHDMRPLLCSAAFARTADIGLAVRADSHPQFHFAVALNTGLHRRRLPACGGGLVGVRVGPLLGAMTRIVLFRAEKIHEGILGHRLGILEWDFTGTLHTGHRRVLPAELSLTFSACPLRQTTRIDIAGLLGCSLSYSKLAVAASKAPFFFCGVCYQSEEWNGVRQGGVEMGEGG